MRDGERMDEQEDGHTGASAARLRRRQRLSAALRENLLKRKAQTRARTAGDVNDGLANAAAKASTDPPPHETPDDAVSEDHDPPARSR
jgi:hypothetical protein